MNDLLRVALLHQEQEPSRRTLKTRPTHMGYRTGLNYDSVESLLAYGEGIDNYPRRQLAALHASGHRPKPVFLAGNIQLTYYAKGAGSGYVTRSCRSG